MSKTFLSEGDSIEVKGSGKKPYIVKKSGEVVDCSCPAWRNIGGPIDVRVCKHIRANVDRACLLPQTHIMYDNKASKPAKGDKNAPKPAAVKKVTAPPVLLAHSWTDEDPTGWWMSEKLDGCVSSGTVIETLERGKIVIDVVVREKLPLHVKSMNHETGEVEYNKISSWSELPSNEDWYEIETEDGTKLVVTGNHEIFVPKLNVYRQVKDLTCDDELLLDK